VIISDVSPGSPADSAGLKIQDIITSIDGHPADSLPSLRTRLFMRKWRGTDQVGSTARSRKLSFDVLVIEVPHDIDRLTALIDPGKSQVPILGIVGVEIDSKLAPSLSGLRISSGVIVAAKSADSNADVPLAPGM